MQENNRRNSQALRLEQSIGREVRAARSAAALTLKELSQLSGVSSAMISKIERGQVSASIATLDAIARAVGMPVANFFAATVERREVSFVRSGEGIAMERTGSTYGHSYMLIGRIALERVEFESCLITLEQTASGEPAFQHIGIEFIHVLEGCMVYRCGDKVFDMAPGDSLTFECVAPHGPIKLKSERVSFLTIIARPAKASASKEQNLLWR